MRTQNLHWISALSLIVGLAATGCAKDDGNADATSAESGSTSGDPSATSVSATVSASDTSASMTGMTSSMDSEGSSDSGPSTVSVSAGTTTGEAPKENGEMCDSNDQCISEMCFVVGPLGGICGDCLTDADCADTTGGGCSIPNPLAQPPEGAACNMGESGAGCMSDAVCVDGQVCATILDVPGILTASTCSECLDDTGCTDGALCSPSYDVANLSGVKTCVQPGSVPDGEGCDLTEGGSGNMACEHGFCLGADVLGVLELGVCNPCGTDADCTGTDVCNPPTVDLMMGLVAGGCGAPA